MPHLIRIHRVIIREMNPWNSSPHSPYLNIVQICTNKKPGHPPLGLLHLLTYCGTTLTGNNNGQHVQTQKREASEAESNSLHQARKCKKSFPFRSWIFAGDAGFSNVCSHADLQARGLAICWLSLTRWTKETTETCH